jgi:hypothetical protein
VGGYNYCYGNNQWGDDGHNNGHETSVAGIIGARTNNSIGMAGIAGGWGNGNNVGPALYSLRITDGGGPGVLDVLINAIYGACHTFDCDILNMSLGIGTYSDALLEVIKMAQSEKRILVAAAGNEGYLLSNPINPHNVYPAQFEDATMIVVGSYGQNGNRCRTEFGNCCSDGSCYSSNYGYPLDFIAPGISIPSISPNSGYNLNFWGTSAACPQATGVIALALSRIPDLWSEDINWIFKKAAVDAGPVGFDDDFGWGRLNAGNLFSILLPANVDHGKINHFSEQMGGYHEIELYYEAQMKFYGVDGLSHSTMYQAECWKAIYYVAYPADFEMCMGVWGNRYAIPGVDESTPWSAANPNYTTGFCEVVPGSDTKEGCSLAGYFFHVNIGNEWRWFPCDPADCPTYLNYSVWGIIKDGTPNRPGGEKLDSQQRNMLTANCYPNPSNAGFNILYDLNNDSYIEITIFDIMGRTIKTLFKGQRTEGQYSINWDGKDNSGINISTGIYFYHISSAFGSKIGRIVLVK